MPNNRKDYLGKFDARSEEGVFLGYSSTNKAYRVFNKRTLCVEENVHVKFYESGIRIEICVDHEVKELIKYKELAQKIKKRMQNFPKDLVLQMHLDQINVSIQTF